jgi:hypothetical protein
MSDRILALGNPALSQKRHPSRVQDGSRSVPVVAGEVEDLAGTGTRAVCLNHAEPHVVSEAVESGFPLLIDLPSLALVNDPQRTLTAPWIPYLPLSWEVDVKAAATLVREGVVGTVRALELTTYVGSFRQSSWDVSTPFPATAPEAAAFGLDAAWALTGQLPTVRRVGCRGEGPYATLLGEEDPTVTIQLRPQASSAVPVFQAVVVGDEGSILLRAPFAAGSLTVWENGPGRYRMPALPRTKPNIQAPDSERGGVGATLALQALLADELSAQERDQQQRALTLLQQPALAELPPHHTGG